MEDESRYGNNGTITGATWTQLPSGLWVMSFDVARDDYITIPDAPSLDLTGDMAINIWFKRAAIGTSEYLLSKYKDGNDFTIAYRLLFSTNTLLVGFGGGGAISNLFEIAIIANTNWNLLSVTVAGTAVQGYVNGVAAGAEHTFLGIRQVSTQPLTIGARITTSNNVYGQIGLSVIQNYALSADQINAIFAAERTLFGV